MLNPFTSNKIELPDGVSWIPKGSCSGAFTLVDGKPDLVVFTCLQNGCIRLWTIRVTDHNSLWTEHTTKIPPPWDGLQIRHVIIIGQNIYIVFELISEFLVFNLSSSEWDRGQDFMDFSIDYVDTNKGLLWRMDIDSRDAAMFRLNENCREWEELKVENCFGGWF